jgi:predicted outer membrane repeat protein
MKICCISRTLAVAAVVLAGLTGTNAAVPQVTTSLATGVNSNYAILHGFVNPGGQSTTAWFKYANYYLSAQTNLPATNGFIAVDLPVSRDDHPSRYPFVLIASNVEAVVTSAEGNFAMEAMPFTDSAKTITTDSAILDGIVEKGSLPMQVYFQWGQTTNYGNFSATNTSLTEVGETEVSTTISNLAPATKYHYRIVTSTSAGTNYGNDVMFLSLTPSAGTWIPLANNPPGAVQSMVLLSDGSVLAVEYNSANWFKLTPTSTGSYINGTWSTSVKPMNYVRSTFSSAVMRDGKVLVSGGEYGVDNDNNAEVYDPVTDGWTNTQPVTNISTSIHDAAVSMLPDGRVLVGIVGPNVPDYQNGYPLIYDPVTNGWTKAGNYARGLHNQDEATWVKLPDDSILEVDYGTRHSERYIPNLDRWIPDADAPVDLWALDETGPALMLPNGKAFLIGGSGHTAIYTPSGSTNLGTWVPGADIPNAMGALDAPAAMMVNGKILCAVTRLSSEYKQPSMFYEYDYLSDTFALVSAPGGITELNESNSLYDASGTVMLDLPDGSVLFTKTDSTPYIYRPLGPPLAAGRPNILSITANGNGSLHLTGTLFNGISTGSSYGDDAGNDSNYPLVRFTDGIGFVRYGRTYNWSSTGVQTGTNIVSTDCTMPAGASLQDFIKVVANGISSVDNSLVVSNINDSGAGSLRQTIASATNNSFIKFDPSLSGQTITLTSGEILLNKNLIIDASTLPGGIGVDGNHSSRLFNVSSGVSVVLNRFVLTNGYPGAGISGGAIVNVGSLKLNGCTLANNITSSSASGGAIWNNGPLTLRGCTLSGNSAGYAGAINNYSNCTLLNCTFAFNLAIAGNGGAIDNVFGARLDLLHCTFSGNAASAAGGAIDNYLSQLNLTNSIIAGNTAKDIYNWSGSTLSCGSSNIVQALDNAGTVNNASFIINADPQLLPLGNYGGPTQTMPPQLGSPAIDAGDSSYAAALGFDQRGPDYPRLIGVVDLGAVETTFVPPVLTTADSGYGSLRFAANWSTYNPVITFAPSLSGQTITLTSGEIALNKNLTIDGSALASSIRIDGNLSSRIFNVAPGAVLTLNSLVLTHGYGYLGGAMLNNGQLTMLGCTLYGNSAQYGGAILSYGTCTLQNCTLTGNSASQNGGAIYSQYAAATLNLLQCTLSLNNAGTQGGGIVNDQSYANITNTVIAGNSNGLPQDVFTTAGGTSTFGGSNIVQQMNFDAGTVIGSARSITPSTTRPSLLRPPCRARPLPSPADKSRWTKTSPLMGRDCPTGFKSAAMPTRPSLRWSQAKPSP